MASTEHRGLTTFVTVVVIFLSTLVKDAVSFRCYACSYTITGLPKLNFECADEPWNFTVGQPIINCDNSRYCVTKTVYTPDLKTIRSMQRSCGTPETVQCGQNCCQKSLYDYTCQFQCQGDLCNNNDETKRLGTDHSPGGASYILPIQFGVLTMFVLIMKTLLV